MYLYLSLNESGSRIETTVIGVGASTRGKPAKNHHPAAFTVGVAGWFYVGILSETDAAKIGSVSEARAAVTRLTAPLPLFPTSRTELMQLFGAAVLGILNKATSTPAIAAVKTALQKQFDTLAESLLPEEIAEANETIAEILLQNRKLLNTVLADYPDGGWWHKKPTELSAPTAAPSAEPSEPEKAADETDSHPESIKMATTTNFGFGKISGHAATSTASAGGAPTTLRVAGVTEEAEKDTAMAGVFMPTPDETYIINDNIGNLFKILQISRQNCPQNVKLVGPHGCGKTELAIQFAAQLKLPLLIMDCANLREARDWFGYKSAREGTVFWHESQFVKAVEAGNHVILLDELNRANPHLLNTLMPLLDARRFTYLEEKGDKICVGPGTVFFASMNEGAGYTGTSALDRAIRDRFPRAVELTYLGEDDEIKLLMKRVGINEELATRLVQMANKIRQDATGLTATLTESLSTRQLIAAAHDLAIGGVETLTFTIINHFSTDGDDDSERVRVQNILQGKFGDLWAAEAEKKAKKGA